MFDGADGLVGVAAVNTRPKLNGAPLDFDVFAVDITLFLLVLTLLALLELPIPDDSAAGLVTGTLV